MNLRFYDFVLLPAFLFLFSFFLLNVCMYFFMVVFVLLDRVLIGNWTLLEIVIHWTGEETWSWVYEKKNVV